MRIVALCFLVWPMRRNFSIPKLPDPQIFTNRKEADSKHIAPRRPRRRSEWHAASQRLTMLRRSGKIF
jgi:hypothetical protein